MAKKVDSVFRIYWRSYGGSAALIRSPFLWAAVFITGLLYPKWSQPLWWNDVLSIMPNMLGFTLGGYAMWMAIGDDKFRTLISGERPSGTPSPYMTVNALFVHFILLQITAILLALVAQAYDFPLPPDSVFRNALDGSFYTLVSIGSFLSYFVFIYAILSALAATLALLRVSRWYDLGQSGNHKK
jgi:hypothetical protein